MKLIVQIGLKRSGNHGLLNLMKKCWHNDKIVHLNDLKKFTYDLYRHNSTIQMGTCESTNIWTGFKGADLVIISLENKNIDETLVELKKFYHIPDFHAIVLLRNPYNNAASAYKYLVETHCVAKNELTQRLMKQWKEYALFLLSHQFIGNTIPIIYDKFYQNEQYRKDIFDLLGMNYKKEYLNQVVGWGTSFFNIYCKDSSKMNIFERFLVFQNDPFFINYIFNDKDLLDLWRGICAKFPPFDGVGPALISIIKKSYENGGNTQLNLKRDNVSKNAIQ